MNSPRTSRLYAAGDARRDRFLTDEYFGYWPSDRPGTVIISDTPPWVKVKSRREIRKEERRQARMTDEERHEEFLKKKGKRYPKYNSLGNEVT